MADTLTFTATGAGAPTALTVTPIKGSVKAGGGHDDRGGGRIPMVRAGWAYNGSCKIFVDTASGGTIAELAALVAATCNDGTNAVATGPGGVTVTGAGLYLNIRSAKALVDVEISGDSVQEATITWKGTAI
jgi:hypothetical protein